MDYCRSCGSEVADGTRRCPNCGDPIDETASWATGDEALFREIQDLAEREGVIAAVKGYREATGCDLKTAKDAVDRLMAGSAPEPTHHKLPVERVEQQVLDLAQSAGKIAAIKHYRLATGCGLKDAKEAVESLLRQHGVQARSGSGCAGVLLSLLVIGLGLCLQL